MQMTEQTFEYQGRLYTAIINNNKLKQVIKGGEIWKSGKICEFAKDKFIKKVAK